MGIEQLDQFGEVGERASETIDLVDHNDIDLAGPYILQQALQRRPVG